MLSTKATTKLSTKAKRQPKQVLFVGFCRQITKIDQPNGVDKWKMLSTKKPSTNVVDKLASSCRQITNVVDKSTSCRQKVPMLSTKRNSLVDGFCQGGVSCLAHYDAKPSLRNFRCESVSCRNLMRFVKWHLANLQGGKPYKTIGNLWFGEVISDFPARKAAGVNNFRCETFAATRPPPPVPRPAEAERAMGFLLVLA